MKRYLLKIYKKLTSKTKTPDKPNFVFIEKDIQMKLLFSQKKKVQEVLLADKLVSIYTVPVVNCEDPSLYKKRIINALNKYFYDKKMSDDWAFYDIENKEVKVCKL